MQSQFQPNPFRGASRARYLRRPYDISEFTISERQGKKTPFLRQILVYLVICFLLGLGHYWMVYVQLRNHYRYVSHSAISCLTLFFFFLIIGVCILPILRKKQIIHILIDESNITLGFQTVYSKGNIDYSRLRTFCELSPHSLELSEFAKLFDRHRRNIVTCIAATSRMEMKHKLISQGISATHFPLIRDRKTGASKESSNDMYLLLAASRLIHDYASYTSWMKKMFCSIGFMPKPILCIVTGDSNMENIASSFPLTGEMAVKNGFAVEVVYWRDTIGKRAWSSVATPEITFRPLDEVGLETLVEGNWYLLPDAQTSNLMGRPYKS